jgi:hypothetical protein
MKNAALTVRLPAPLKHRLEERAAEQHRSLSAQVVAELDAATRVAAPAIGGPGSFLGLYAGSRLPTDDEVAEVRARLWSRLPMAPSGDQAGESHRTG